MALLASGSHCRVPFGRGERVGRPLGSARLELLAERNLLRGEALLTIDCCPAWRRMPAAQEVVSSYLRSRWGGADISAAQARDLLRRLERELRRTMD